MFVTGKPLKPSIIFESMRSTRKAARLTQGWKGLSRTNALAYSSVTMKKSFMTCSPRQSPANATTWLELKKVEINI